MKRIVERIGMAGVAAIGLLAAALFFSNFMVRPLEERNALLKQSASGKANSAAPSGAKVAAVYAYLQKEEATTDWLAKLHGIGTATGVEMRAATYGTKPAEGRIVRGHLAGDLGVDARVSIMQITRVRSWIARIFCTTSPPW